MKKLCDQITVIKQGKNIYSVDLDNLVNYNNTLEIKIRCLQSLEGISDRFINYLGELKQVNEFNIEGEILIMKVRKKKLLVGLYIN